MMSRQKSLELGAVVPVNELLGVDTDAKRLGDRLLFGFAARSLLEGSLEVPPKATCTAPSPSRLRAAVASVKCEGGTPPGCAHARKKQAIVGRCGEQLRCPSVAFVGVLQE